MLDKGLSLRSTPYLGQFSGLSLDRNIYIVTTCHCNWFIKVFSQANIWNSYVVELSWCGPNSNVIATYITQSNQAKYIANMYISPKSEIKSERYFFSTKKQKKQIYFEPRCDRHLVPDRFYLDVRREKAKEGSARRNIPPAELGRRWCTWLDLIPRHHQLPSPPYSIASFF